MFSLVSVYVANVINQTVKIKALRQFTCINKHLASIRQLTLVSAQFN